MASLTKNGWVQKQVPEFSGEIGDVTRIPGTTSFLMNAGADIDDDNVARPTIFRFDLWDKIRVA